MNWSGVVEAIVKLLGKWGSAIAAYFAGRAAKTRDVEKNERKEREAQDETDADFERLRRDDALRDRVRDLMAVRDKPAGVDDPR